MTRFVCIHGHFYQPPRENPWLEEIEEQDSAFPFHDWNERITAECYEPNRAARILDDQQRIIRIASNYARISFNFGPTLLSWLERHRPLTYHAILDADRLSRVRFSGHGAAIAQAYSHLILPLANERDRRTQVRWGLADFEYRFGRKPEGMWLPETAVDIATLEALAAEGLRFTILAPHQARRVRSGPQEAWQEVDAASLDLRRPYLCRLPSGRSLALFFYDGPIARDVAFSGLLNDGGAFARRLQEAFSGAGHAELVHIATDGETYGHHHRFGDMALAFCLDQLERTPQTRLTIYAEHLALHPPQWEVEIAEGTSWSCAHGLERWRADCGCNLGAPPGWSQAWRGPLREALDWLGEQLAQLFETGLRPLLAAPWQARDDYIELLLERTPQRVQAFLQRHAGRPLDRAEQVRALSLLEMQRHAMLMFTSCGWFFDEVSGIETVQILTYASRALQLAEEATGQALEEAFLDRLALVPSNLPRWQNAARIYREQVQPLRLDLQRVAAHHAIAAQFDEPSGNAHLYCYQVETLERQELHNGSIRLAHGRSRVTSEITGARGVFCYAVLHLSAQHLTAGVHPCSAPSLPPPFSHELSTAFLHSDLPEVVRLMDRHYAGGTYSFWHLFCDHRRRIVGHLITQTVESVLQDFTTLYETNYPLLHFLREMRMPLPQPLAAPVEQVLNARLRRQLEEDKLDPQQFRSLLDEAEHFDLKLDRTSLAFTAAARIERLIADLAAAPDDTERLSHTLAAVNAIQLLPWPLDLWQAQNLYLQMHATATSGSSPPSPDWRDGFQRLGAALQIRIA